MELLLIVLPVFMIFAIGFIGQKKLGFDIPNLSRMYVFLIAPFLSFRTFYQNALSMDYFYMGVYLLMLSTSIILIVKIVAKLNRYSNQETCGVILASAFMNNGNYGVPVALFAFGAIGLDYAVVLMIMQSMLMNTVGVYYAAKGSSHHYNMMNALKAVGKMPIIYGAFIGLIWQKLNLPMSHTIYGGIEMVADAAIPLLMIILGMQLASIKLDNIPIQKISFSLALRMVVSPVIAIGIAFILPVDDVLRKIFILMAAMPTAAYITMLSLQFETEPNLVTSTTFISTLVSLITIPVVLFFLM